MKMPLLLLGLLLLALVLALTWQRAHSRHPYQPSASPAHAPRVLRTPAVARQPRYVRAVK
jgi:hypothetical protein